MYFERALELPGTGLKRWRDKPPALSTGELTSALYNVGAALCMACPAQLSWAALLMAAHAWLDLSCANQGAADCGWGSLARASADSPPPPMAAPLPPQIACCRSRLGDIENGLVAMAGAIEQGEHARG